MKNLISETGREKHLKEAMSLESEGYEHLLHLRIRNREGVWLNVYLANREGINWRGQEWTFCPFLVKGIGLNSSGENSRPTLSIFNPENLFTQFATQGYLTGAIATQYDVLSSHLETNTNSFIKRVWRAGRLLTAIAPTIVLEMRGAADTPGFIIPARQFLPPEFRQVSI